MAYERINWQNGEVGNTPLNANNLNRMDMTLEEHDQKIGDHDYEIENLKTGAQGITEEINKKMDRINPQGSGTLSITAVNTDNITAQTVEADEIKVTKVSSKGGTAPVAFDNDILVNGITTPIGSLASSASDKAESANERAENAYNLASRANREAASAINLANDNKAKIDLHTGLIGEGVGDKVPIPSYTDGYYIAPDGRVTQYNATATLIKIEFLDFFFRGDNIIFNHVDLLPTENCIPCAWYDISGNFISAADGLNIIAEIDEQTFKITKQYIDYCIIPVPAGASSCKLSGLANGSADIRIQASLSDAIKELQSKPEPATLVLTNPSPLPCTDGKKILGIHAKGNSTQNGTPTPTNPIEIIDASTEVVAKSEDGTQSNTITLPYTLKSVGNVADELVVNEDGSGKLIQNIEVVTLKGSENWVKSGNNFYAQFNDIERQSNYIGYMLSDHFSVASNNNAMTNNTISAYMKGSDYAGQNWLYIRNDACADVSALKTWLASNNVTVYFARKTPIETPLTASEVASIRQLQTYKGTTVIDSEMDVASVSYSGDVKGYVDSKTDYSYTDQIIGKWADGKDLHRIVVNTNTPSSSGGIVIPFLNGNNCDIKNMYGFINWTSDTKVPINYYSTSTNFATTYPSTNGIVMSMGNSLINKPCEITVEYTLKDTATASVMSLDEETEE